MIYVLFSGGIDSLACLLWAVAKFGRDKVQPIYMDFGQKYLDKEVSTALAMSEWLKLRPVKLYRVVSETAENVADGHIPLRNTFMMMSIAAMDDAEGLVFGMLKGESCEDKNPVYIKLMQKLFDSQFKASIYRKETRPFKIYTPFARMQKTQVVAWMKRVAPNIAPILLPSTVACLHSTGKEKPCGQCISCLNRWVALTLNDIPVEEHMMHPYIWTVYQIKNRKRLESENAALFTKSQFWMKRRWLFDVLRAMVKYSESAKLNFFRDVWG